MNLKKSARGEACQLQIPQCCNHNPETTVLCHVGSHGTAKRNHDDEAVFGCSDCHDAIDRRSRRFLSNDPLMQAQLNDDRRFFVGNALGRMKAWKRDRGLL